MVFHFETLRGLVPGAALLSMLALFKLLECTNKRDYHIFLMISLLLFLTQSLSLSSLWIVLYIVFISLFAFILLYKISSQFLNIEVEVEVDRSSSNYRSIIFLLLTSLPLSAILFVFFPRIATGNFFASTSNEVGLTGFSEQLNPGEISRLVETSQNVFRARFTEPSNLGFEDLYWRGRTLSYSEGLSWRPRERSGEYVGNRRLNLKQNLEVDASAHYRLVMNQSYPSPIFHLEGSYHFESISPGRFYKYSDQTVKFRPGNNQPGIFDIQQLERVNIEKAFDSNQYLELPEKVLSSQKFLRWRDKMRESEVYKSGETQEIVASVVEIFGREDFTYSLEPGGYDEEDGLEEFFFERKIGFCEHYAALTGVLLRMLDVPSRVVVGFHGGEFNTIGDYYSVSTKDAHAWVEYWSQELESWQRVDPTAYLAPDRIHRGAEFYLLSLEQGREEALNFFEIQRSSFMRNLMFRFDAIYFNLNQAFLSYDIYSQKKILERLGINLDEFSFNKVFFILLLVMGILLGFCIIGCYFFNSFLIRFRLSEKEKLKNDYIFLISKINKSLIKNFGRKDTETWLGLSNSPRQNAERLTPWIANDREFNDLITKFEFFYFSKGKKGEVFRSKEVKKLSRSLRDFQPIFLKI